MKIGKCVTNFLKSQFFLKSTKTNKNSKFYERVISQEHTNKTLNRVHNVY